MLNGDGGNDTVVGGLGDDNLDGGADNDDIVDGPYGDTADDNIQAGGGNDRISSDNNPAAKDHVDCGTGYDRVVADHLDEVASNCEEVRVVPDREAQAQAQAQSDFSALQTGEVPFGGEAPGYFRGFFLGSAFLDLGEGPDYASATEPLQEGQTLYLTSDPSNTTDITIQLVDADNLLFDTVYDEVTLSPGQTLPVYTYEGGLFDPNSFELYALSNSFFSQPITGNYEIA